MSSLRTSLAQLPYRAGKAETGKAFREAKKPLGSGKGADRKEG